MTKDGKANVVQWLYNVYQTTIEELFLVHCCLDKTSGNYKKLTSFSLSKVSAVFSWGASIWMQQANPLEIY